jgi:hypothetical protein
MAGHTPGPWKVVDDRDLNPAFGGLLAEVKVPTGSFGRKTTNYRRVGITAWDVHPRDKAPAFMAGEANARLIAAAPDLLRELKAAREFMVRAIADRVDVPGFDPTMHVLIEAIDAAIARAEGGDRG